jgi:16S rRNA (adenine1518-N6/adenine1519-N6)-dimethyltransferase
LTQAAFGQRRKMLRQSLKSLCGGDAGPLLARAKVSPELRAEEIGIADFVALAGALAELRGIGPR